MASNQSDSLRQFAVQDMSIYKFLSEVSILNCAIQSGYAACTGAAASASTENTGKARLPRLRCRIKFLVTWQLKNSDVSGAGPVWFVHVRIQGVATTCIWAGYLSAGVTTAI
jgi:hypothetical protein